MRFPILSHPSKRSTRFPFLADPFGMRLAGIVWDVEYSVVDVSFYLNDVFIGSWTSPGDFGETKGIFTPGWWYPNWNQYGMLKLLVINNKGTFIDGLQMSDVSIKDLNLTDRSAIRFRLAVNDDAEHVGGLTIYGKNFGNYNQNIDVKINYSPLAE